MRLIIFILLPVILFSDNLKDLLEFAKSNNNLLSSSKISISYKTKEFQSAKSSYYPTLDANVFYEKDDEPNSFFARETYGTTFKVGWDIYDGEKKYHIKKQKLSELNAVKLSYNNDEKSIFLSITKDFFNLKTLYASLEAKEEALKTLKAQLDRMQQFYDAKIATIDDVDKLKSEYSKNLYLIQTLKFKILSLKKLLELEVGKSITTLDNSKFKKSLAQKSLELDAIKAIKENKNALINLSETIDSYYYPNIRIEDSYTFFGYKDKPVYAEQAIPMLDTQNKLMLTLGLRLFDFGTLREQKEALKLKADALNEQIIYKSKEQKMQLELSEERIKTANLNIKSSLSTLKFTKRVLKTITNKYNAGVVDNITYLDALSSYTEAKSVYEKSLNDLEIAYAIYYYYNAKKLENFL